MTATAERPTITLDPTPIAVDPRLDKLASLIEQGARLRPQGFGGLFVADGPGEPIHSCALGAAVEAAGGVAQSMYNMDDYTIPFMAAGLRENTRIKDGWRATSTICDEIIHLNDTEHWTREAIAAHIRTLTLED